ncbi:hypothetical protein LEM8419_03574 [Neolewinella maritima]|uniref:DUF4376 domain-containing protein n=1 Tax=Neolewinella maritima TaxID=1383882 RepID=A0ABN8FE80_9BACT|nr:hypothetical protein LEM8419_03574 [Neolewinella maritima]
MAQQIIKQPNGRFCVWDNGSYSMCCFNGTKEEILDFYERQVRESVEDKVRSVREDVSLQMDRIEMHGPSRFARKWEDVRGVLTLEQVRECE